MLSLQFEVFLDDLVDPKFTDEFLVEYVRVTVGLLGVYVDQLLLNVVFVRRLLLLIYVVFVAG